MPLIEPLERAKEYIKLPLANTEQQERQGNAVKPAENLFKKNYKIYKKLKYMDYNIIGSVEDNSDERIRVYLTKKQIKNIYCGFNIGVDSGVYIGEYVVKEINKDLLYIILDVEYETGEDSIDIVNDELQLYNDALAWYICSFTRFTNQEIKDCKILVTSTQIGSASSQSYSQSQIENFRQILKNEGDLLLTKKHYPRIF